MTLQGIAFSFCDKNNNAKEQKTTVLTRKVLLGFPLLGCASASACEITLEIDSNGHITRVWMQYGIASEM